MDLPVRVCLKTLIDEPSLILIMRFDADFEYGGLLKWRNKSFAYYYGKAFDQIASNIYQTIKAYGPAVVDPAKLPIPNT